MNAFELQEKLNKTTILDMDNILIGDELLYVLKEQEFEMARFASGLKDIVYMLYRTVSQESYDWNMVGTGGNLCLFSNSYRGREDHKRAFLNVIKLIPDRIEMVVNKHSFRIPDIDLVRHIFIWNRQLKKIIPEFGKRQYLIRILLIAFSDYKYAIRNIEKRGIKLHHLIVYCDVMPVDCFFVQKFNLQNITTITLQHGSFNIKTNPWPYSLSKSTFFLAENQQAVDCGKLVNCQSTLIPVGSPHHINMDKPRELSNIDKVDFIGCIMNGATCEEENIPMLVLLQDYCRRYGARLIVKFHPANKIENYRNVIDETISSTYKSEITMEEFANLIDVAVVSASTVFTTMLSEGKPVFLFARENFDPKLFLNTDYLKFHSLDTLRGLIIELKSQTFLEKYRLLQNYYLVDGSIRDNYIRAFHDIGVI